MQPFQLLIKPASGDCNLACGYCFYSRVPGALYPHEHRRMTLELMEALVAEHMGHGFGETVFVWQGGEPTLMGLEFFRQVVEAQKHHGRPGQVVGNALQTNGLLLDEQWAAFLARNKFLVGLSLDGPRDLHDAHRRDQGGHGTWDRVMAAARLLDNHGVACNILTVLTRGHERRGRAVYRFLRQQGFRHLHFIPCLERDGQTGLPTDFSITPGGLNQFLADAFDEYRREGPFQVSERNFDALLNFRLSGRAGLCTLGGNCGDYLLVEHNGDVYLCDFFVQPAWRLGRAGDTPLAELLQSPLMARFRAARGELDPQCGRCRWLEWCHGGCLKDRLPSGPDAPGRSHFCRAYAGMFERSSPHLAKWAAQAAGGP